MKFIRDDVTAIFDGTDFVFFCPELGICTMINHIGDAELSSNSLPVPEGLRSKQNSWRSCGARRE